MSGAGRTSCLKILEDLGYEAVDNLPTALLDRLLRADDDGPAALAIGIDSRTRGLDPAALVNQWQRLRRDRMLRLALLYVECDDEVLRRRFSETRRRHPFGEIAEVAQAIREERAFMAPLKEAADLLIDTSQLALPDLRRLLVGQLAEPAGRLKISVVSFSFKRGLPREADLVLDVRFLRNPHYDPLLRPLTGFDAAVQDRVRSDPDFQPFITNMERLLLPLLPRFGGEGKSYLTIAIGCTGGRHRSVFVATRLAAWLGEAGWDVSVRHRDLPDGNPSPDPARTGRTDTPGVNSDRKGAA